MFNTVKMYRNKPFFLILVSLLEAHEVDLTEIHQLTKSKVCWVSICKMLFNSRVILPIFFPLWLPQLWTVLSRTEKNINPATLLFLTSSSTFACFARRETLKWARGFNLCEINNCHNFLLKTERETITLKYVLTIKPCTQRFHTGSPLLRCNLVEKPVALHRSSAPVAWHRRGSGGEDCSRWRGGGANIEKQT